MGNNDSSKKLFLDIETSPNIALTWGKYDQTVPAFVKEWEVLSISYMWEINGKPGKYNQYSRLDSRCTTDRALMKKIGKLLDDADIMIAHNGRKFDQKKINTRLLKHGLPIPSPVKVIDTLEVVKRNFSLNSNRLNDIAEFLGLGKKVKTGGIDLWIDCMQGVVLPGKVIKKAWNTMIKYNIHDTRLLFLIYNYIKGWIHNHPNVTIYGDRPTGCPTCGSIKLKSKGWCYKKTTSYRRFQCKNCGGYCRTREQYKQIQKPEHVEL